MALVIENGSVVAGANSFVTVAEVRAFAAARASDLSALLDPAIEAAAIKAVDYIKAQEPKMQGSRVAANQPLSYPREGVSLYGFPFPDDAIPQELKDAQCQAAIESAMGRDLMPTGSGKAVVREKVDVLEVEYANASGAPQPRLVAVDAFLAPLLGGSGGRMVILERY